MGVADVTELVHAAGNGDAAALQQLFVAVYDELKTLAHRQLARGAGATIDTTGLVHETYLKLVVPDALKLHDRGHFFATAARAMRQIVIDHARRRHADKRGGALQAVTLVDDLDGAGLDPETLIHLDAALTRLAAMEPALAELVELRFFAGLSVEQVAELRDVAPRTVIRDWRRARAFLFDSVHPQA
ncbi:ECF-type sigma factor [Rudaea cellulosilytica]|uniref:ECF-type sigma factor n=1 Tax=Rudaea cellulosilytica TaxID=540746 RepID=UPI00036F03AA|nr:ECF-type sigma factor [Rudaea cellulosilytica]